MITDDATKTDPAVDQVPDIVGEYKHFQLSEGVYAGERVGVTSINYPEKETADAAK